MTCNLHVATRGLRRGLKAGTLLEYRENYCRWSGLIFRRVCGRFSTSCNFRAAPSAIVGGVTREIAGMYTEAVTVAIKICRVSRCFTIIVMRGPTVYPRTRVRNLRGPKAEIYLSVPSCAKFATYRIIMLYAAKRIKRTHEAYKQLFGRLRSSIKFQYAMRDVRCYSRKIRRKTLNVYYF